MTRKPSLLLLVLAFLAATLLVLSGTGVRFELWDFRMGLQLLRWSAYAGIVVALAAVACLMIPRVRSGHVAAVLIALAIGVGVAAVPINWQRQAKAAPAIHDITTDAENPPAFVAVVPLRAGAPNPVTYGGKEIADAQHRAYPDIKPLILNVTSDVAFTRAVDAASVLGWNVVAADALDGRIEATDTTRWFGFKDDIVVRIAPDAGGSRIDVRSVSRVGRGDVGMNARRIRAYLAKVAGVVK